MSRTQDLLANAATLPRRHHCPEKDLKYKIKLGSNEVFKIIFKNRKIDFTEKNTYYIPLLQIDEKSNRVELAANFFCILKQEKRKH